MKNLVNIYVLITPIGNKVFYVGATKLQLAQRLIGHIAKASLPTIQELKKQGLKPIYKIIEVVDKSLAAEKEVEWIAFYKSLGFVLDNIIEFPTYCFNRTKNEYLRDLRRNGKVKVTHTEIKSLYKTEKHILHLGKPVKRPYTAIELF